MLPKKNTNVKKKLKWFAAFNKVSIRFINIKKLKLKFTYKYLVLFPSTQLMVNL